MLYAFGSNGSGQLGLGHCEDVSLPSEVPLPASVSSEEACNIKNIIAGGNHTLLLLETRELYACGTNTDGRCSTTPNQPCSTTFQKVEIQHFQGQSISKFSFCAATWESSTFVDSEGRLFTSGTGSKGQLGQGLHVSKSPSAKLVTDFPPSGLRIMDLAACMGHTVAVLSDGSVYGWGTGRKGQLGRPSEDCWEPRKIEGIPFHAVRAVCGKDFTYVVGDRHSGQHSILGSDKWHVTSAAPRDVYGWKDIKASWNSIYVVLDSGILLAWGRNDHSQIPSQAVTAASRVAAGSEHALVLEGGTGTCLAYGWGEHGNCGDLNGNEDAPSCGNSITLDASILQIGAGCATSWIFTK